jgi:hypothetical protein
MVHSEADSRINNALIRMLALELARLGADLPLFDEEASSVRQRYAPMHRLLSDDDELFLMAQGFRTAARKLRRQHRNCYFRYLAGLSREIRTARKLGALAMASEENWSFWNLLARMAISETSLLYLRWLGCRHAAGISVAARDVKECLDFLLAAQRLRLATT